MTTFTTFLNKINQFSELLGLSQEDMTKIKSDLLEGVFYDLTSNLASDPNQKTNLENLSKIKPVTQDDFDKFMSEASTLLKNEGYDINEAFDKSAKTVLEAFIAKLGNSLPQDKIEALNKI